MTRGRHRHKAGARFQLESSETEPIRGVSTDEGGHCVGDGSRRAIERLFRGPRRDEDRRRDVDDVIAKPDPAPRRSG